MSALNPRLNGSSILQKYTYMGTIRPIAVAGCLLALLVAAPASVGRAGLASGLTADETRRLDAGELITRPASQRKGSLRLFGGTSYQLINASPEVVWKALLDTPHYHRMMPRVLEARLVSRRADERTVFLRQGAKGWVEKRYYLKVKVYADRRDMTFVMDDRRPADLDAVWGFYSVRAYAGERTLLTYGVMADLGDGLLVALLGGSLQDWMLKAPWMVKQFVEGRSGRLVR